MTVWHKVLLAMPFSLGALPCIAWEQSPADPSIYTADVAEVSCQPRQTCKQIDTCEEARWYLDNCSWGGRLDGDSDGSPCEQLCGSNN